MQIKTARPRILGVNGIRLLGYRSGVGRAIEAILKYMGELPHPFDEIRVYTPAPLDETVFLPAGTKNIVLPSRLPLGLWEQITLPRAHGTKHLLLCPSYVVPIAARCPTLLIHHGSYEGWPAAFSPFGRFKARMQYQFSARRASVVSTVSKHSKRDIIRFYGLAEKNISVVPEGVDTELFQPNRDQKALSAWRRKVLGADVPFIVYVGKHDERRNVPNLIKAFAQVKREHDLPHKLLLIGSDVRSIPLDLMINDAAMKDSIVCLGFAKHQEIALAYNASEMLIYPTSYEGFGMPVLEAMACGTPVISTNLTAIPEFAHGVAMLVESPDIETLKSAIIALHRDKDLQKKMAADGPVRAANFDWRIITKQYIALMAQLVIK